MAFIFRIVVTHEFLFASHQFYPIGVFHLCGITSASLLLLHLFVELLHVYRIAVFATDEFG